MNRFILSLITFVLIVCGLPAVANTLSYDYSSVTSVPIHLIITKKLSTKDGLIEGQEIQFKVSKDVIYNGKTIVKSGEIVSAKIETVISSGMNGFPAEIIVDNFSIPNIPNSKLLSTYVDVGQNRCLMVYPLKWALTPIPFAGTLTNFIKGGHAVIKPKEDIVIYYYPDWK